ncbi:MAG TPA: hypothetical protein VGR57_18470 [Ktedonobacterales bacterium]|nr:hypothetical protein [Ktedonobacterales bacterium]
MADSSWLRRLAPQRASAPTDATSSDAWFKEWSECRALISRFDAILADLRKYGFTLVTGLFTASALIGGLGATTATPSQRAAVFIGIMALIVVLFFMDTYYETLLNGAVERALDLEHRARRAVDLTSYLATNAARNGSTYATCFVYVGLLFTAGFVGFSVAGAGGVFDRLTWSPAQQLVAAWFVVLAALMVGYWLFAQIATGGFTAKERQDQGSRDTSAGASGDPG